MANLTLTTLDWVPEITRVYLGERIEKLMATDPSGRSEVLQ